MKISTIFKILICSILLFVLSFDVNSKDMNKFRRKDDLPKLAVNYAFSYFLTFHPCEMNPTDTNNSVSIYLISTVKGNVKLEITGLGISREQELIPKVINEIKLTPKEAFPYLRSPTDTVMREQKFLWKCNSD